MTLNYLKLAIRLLIRNPFFTLVNVGGLAVGFAVFFILWQFSANEMKTDTQWPDWRRIARVGFWWEWTDDGNSWQSLFHGGNDTGFVPRLTNDYPELETFTRIMYQQDFSEEFSGLDNQIVTAYENRDGTIVRFNERKVVCVDANFFTFFSIPFFEGNPDKALTLTNSMVMSESSARRYFGDDSPVNKTVMANGKTFVVTGVFRDLPHNTHIDFDIAVTNKSRFGFWEKSRASPNVNAYIKSNRVIDWRDFENRINEPAALQKYWGEAFRQYPNARTKTLIQPLGEVAFSNWRGNVFDIKSRTLLRVFQAVGAVVLLMALINFINLTSARTLSRLREIATRKVSGARSMDFFRQFIAESLIVFLLAIAMAFSLIQISAKVIGTELNIPVAWTDDTAFPLFLSVTLFSIVIAAVYPVYISGRFEPKLLFSRLKNRSDSRWPALLTLTSFQYFVAIILMVWGFLVYAQLNYILNRELGFERQEVIVIDAPVTPSSSLLSDMQVFLQRASSQSGVNGITFCARIMGDFAQESFSVRRPGVDYPIVLMSNGGVDESFLPFFNIRLLAGRNFSPSEKNNGVILSEGAVARLGFRSPQEAVGAIIEALNRPSSQDGGVWTRVEIIGVVKSYRLRPLLAGDEEQNSEDSGIALSYRTNLARDATPKKIAIRVSGNIGRTLSRIGEDFRRIFPQDIFNWYFLDENIARQYRNEKVWRNRVIVFTFISIGIACVGLLGMIGNKLAEKTKEIGIRKVMGAQPWHVVGVVLNTTWRQLVIGAVAGIPVGCYLSRQYLEKFSERISPQWWHLVLPVLILAVIMLVSVASVLFRAVRTNPVESIRCE